MLKLLTKNTFLLLYFTTEDMKFLKMEKKGERFITKYSVHNSTEQHNSTY